ncbi:MAG: hypothetical protein LBH69_00095 [Methanomassiliicoccaceae archaeon]|jgi:hypothetical protein|nr:hypothetical protein [Methanomassiliicoccaceae archaeon]
MCNDDIDIEEFVKKHREEIEKILKASEGHLKTDIGPAEKIGDAMKGMLSMFLDPKIQMHFIRAGKEFFTGVEEMMRNAPLPDEMKDTVNKACEMKDRIVKDIVNEMDGDAKSKKDAKEKKMKKIDVE